MSASQDLLDLLKGALGEPEARNQLLGMVGYGGQMVLNSDNSVLSNSGDFNAVSNGPASGMLGPASNYGILAASAITNTGSSVVNGSLGIYPGTSITGFPPGVFTGSEDVANATAHGAQNAALNLYNTLAAHSSTVIPSALDGQVLSAGYYSFASGAATLAQSAPGTLTLNGSASDVFVIKTASTLTTGAGGTPTIALTGGAQAKNVYWVIGSSATINSGNAGVFNGNILANTSITDTSGGTVNGSLIALNGAVTLSAAAIINTFSAGVASYSLYFNPNVQLTIKSINSFELLSYTPRSVGAAESQQAYVTGYGQDGNGNWYVAAYVGDMNGVGQPNPNQNFTLHLQAKVNAVGSED